MKVEVVVSYHDRKFYTVELTQGVQHFRLDYTATREECEWYAEQFRVALQAAGGKLEKVEEDSK
jgi:hypothetical protein